MDEFNDEPNNVETSYSGTPILSPSSLCSQVAASPDVTVEDGVELRRRNKPINNCEGMSKEVCQTSELETSLRRTSYEGLEEIGKRQKGGRRPAYWNDGDEYDGMIAKRRRSTESVRTLALLDEDLRDDSHGSRVNEAHFASGNYRDSGLHSVSCLTSVLSDSELSGSHGSCAHPNQTLAADSRGTVKGWTRYSADNIHGNGNSQRNGTERLADDKLTVNQQLKGMLLRHVTEFDI